MIEDFIEIEFDQDNIYDILIWIDKLINLKYSYKKDIISKRNKISTRIYSDEENEIFNVSCKGFILFLEQKKLLNISIREIIIARAIALNSIKLNLDDLQWISLIIIFNFCYDNFSYKKIKQLILDNKNYILH